MPRKARIDMPGALHHLIIRWIERKRIFRDDQDRNNFLERLGKILLESKSPCYAWGRGRSSDYSVIKQNMQKMLQKLRAYMPIDSKETLDIFTRRCNFSLGLFLLEVVFLA